MNPLDRKLQRDLGRLKGQVITIALVVGCGISAFVTMKGTWASLEYSQQRYYEAYRFADVFAALKRAPDRLRRDISELAGVREVTTRVVESALLPMPGQDEASMATVVGLPLEDESKLNGLHLRVGRMPSPGATEEVVVSEGFARAFSLEPSSSLPIIINGTRRDLEIVGVALSPEFVFPTPPGQMMPDDKRYGVLWMNNRAVAAAFRMEGAFNSVAVTTQPGADLVGVIAALDDLLAPYGSLGAHDRSRQMSHMVLVSEMEQLQSMAGVVPLIFLAVAAFLLNVVLSRLIFLQRPYIATLKAVGYSNLQVGLHYLKFVLIVVAFGTIIGLVAGAWLGRGLTNLYQDIFRFPVLYYRLDPEVIAISVSVSLVAGLLGAFVAVMRVVRLPPAEAMRAKAPERYRRSLIDHLGIPQWIGMSTMMVMREIRRRPLRFALSAVAIACGIGVMIVGRFSADSLDYMLEVHLHEQQPAELSVELRNPVPEHTLRELLVLPGVLDIEGMRAVPVRMKSGHRWRDTAILGIEDQARLRRLVTRDSKRVTLSEDELIITDVLADILDVSAGDDIEVQVRAGDWRVLHLRVGSTIDETFGMQGYLRADTLARLLDEERLASVAYLDIDSLYLSETQRALGEMPNVASSSHKQHIVDLYREQTGKSMGVMTVVLTFFAGIIAIGVIYNNARISLSMRGRDLASLRVLGFTRREISAVLLGELSLQVAAAIPLGLWFGRSWAFAVAKTIDPETFRLPVVISQSTYAYAVVVAILSGLFSAMLVRRKLDQLDLIAVLKTRE